MDLRQRYLTRNECYKEGRRIRVKGLMLHSTGVNNPKLSRYVDAPDLGPISPNHWNQPRPGGRQVCVHGFIGKDQHGNVCTYQTLPWDMRGWHCGGSANNTHIGVEICEDDLKDPKYFAEVYREAVELFAFLCKKFGLTEKDVITHSEGYKKGIASNHADVMHWFPKHGKDMNDFRADIRLQLLGKSSAATSQHAPTSGSYKVVKGDTLWGIATRNNMTVADLKSLNGLSSNTIQPGQVLILKKSTPTPQPVAPSKSIDQLAQEVIKGLHGSGDARRKSLGSQYDAVQKRVNELLNQPKSTPTPEPSVDQLAREVIEGKYGSGDARRKALGSRYDEVQARVNQILGGSNQSGKSIHQLAQEVIKGLHGSGEARRKSLGSQYDAVQKEVNRILKG